MTFLWSPFSAIVHADGTMRKTNKAELGHQLEAQVERVLLFKWLGGGGTNSIHLMH